MGIELTNGAFSVTSSGALSQTQLDKAVKDFQGKISSLSKSLVINNETAKALLNSSNDTIAKFINDLCNPSATPIDVPIPELSANSPKIYVYSNNKPNPSQVYTISTQQLPESADCKLLDGTTNKAQIVRPTTAKSTDQGVAQILPQQTNQRAVDMALRQLLHIDDSKLDKNKFVWNDQNNDGTIQYDELSDDLKKMTSITKEFFDFVDQTLHKGELKGWTLEEMSVISKMISASSEDPQMLNRLLTSKHFVAITNKETSEFLEKQKSDKDLKDKPFSTYLERESAGRINVDTETKAWIKQLEDDLATMQKRYEAMKTTDPESAETFYKWIQDTEALLKEIKPADGSPANINSWSDETKKRFLNVMHYKFRNDNIYQGSSMYKIMEQNPLWKTVAGYMGTVSPASADDQLATQFAQDLDKPDMKWEDLLKADSKYLENGKLKGTLVRTLIDKLKAKPDTDANTLLKNLDKYLSDKDIQNNPLFKQLDDIRVQARFEMDISKTSSTSATDLPTLWNSIFANQSYLDAGVLKGFLKDSLLATLKTSADIKTKLDSYLKSDAGQKLPQPLRDQLTAIIAEANAAPTTTPAVDIDTQINTLFANPAAFTLNAVDTFLENAAIDPQKYSEALTKLTAKLNEPQNQALKNKFIEDMRKSSNDDIKLLDPVSGNPRAIDLYKQLLNSDMAKQGQTWDGILGIYYNNGINNTLTSNAFVAIAGGNTQIGGSTLKEYIKDKPQYAALQTALQGVSDPSSPVADTSDVPITPEFVHTIAQDVYNNPNCTISAEKDPTTGKYLYRLDESELKTMFEDLASGKWKLEDNSEKDLANKDSINYKRRRFVLEMLINLGITATSSDPQIIRTTKNDANDFTDKQGNHIDVYQSGLLSRGVSLPNYQRGFMDHATLEHLLTDYKVRMESNAVAVGNDVVIGKLETQLRSPLEHLKALKVDIDRRNAAVRPPQKYAVVTNQQDIQAVESMIKLLGYAKLKDFPGCADGLIGANTLDNLIKMYDQNNLTQCIADIRSGKTIKSDTKGLARALVFGMLTKLGYSSIEQFQDAKGLVNGETRGVVGKGTFEQIMQLYGDPKVEVKYDPSVRTVALLTGNSSMDYRLGSFRSDIVPA